MIPRLLGRLFSQPRQSLPSKSRFSSRQRRLTLESLESRQLLTLIGIIPNFPLTKFDSSGALQYTAATQVFDVNATPLSFQLNSSTAPTTITGTPTPHIEMDILVDNSGNLIGGNGHPNDFDMTGTVVVNSSTYSGTLLTGKVLQFGYQYNSGTSTSQFDFRFQTTGGSLQPFFVGMDMGVTMASENSSSFTGSFANNFSGGAKGTVGPISPLPTGVYGYKFDDLNDNGVDNSDPRLSGWTITLAGNDDLGNAVSEMTTTSTNGEYSFTGLAPGTYTIGEQQQTGWTQTAGGTTITLTSGQVAVAYSGEAGTLLPGQVQVVASALAFGNFKSSAIVIGNDKSPVTPHTVNIVNPANGSSYLPSPIVPYGNSFLGGVRVATGDLNGNGFDDIVTAPGRGGLPVINVYDQLGNLLTSFQAYSATVNGGLQVAVADLYGNGLEDIITVPSWGPAEVRVFKNLGVVGGMPVFSSTPSMDFLAFPSSFVGGAVVAAANLGTMPSHTPQIIVGSGSGMKATVEVFNVSSAPPTSPPTLATPVASFNPFNTISPQLVGGVSLSVAQLSSNPIQSIVVGAGAGGHSLVNIWGWNTAKSAYTSLSSPGVAGFPAFTGSSANSPIAIATLSNQGIASAILAVQGTGGATSQVNQLNILSASPLVLSSPTAIPGSYPGPNTIAVINNVETGPPVAQPLVKTSAVTNASAAAVVSNTTNKNATCAVTSLRDSFFALLGG